MAYIEYEKLQEKYDVPIIDLSVYSNEDYFNSLDDGVYYVRATGSFFIEKKNDKSEILFGKMVVENRLKEWHE